MSRQVSEKKIAFFCDCSIMASENDILSATITAANTPCAFNFVDDHPATPPPALHTPSPCCSKIGGNRLKYPPYCGKTNFRKMVN